MGVPRRSQGPREAGRSRRDDDQAERDLVAENCGIEGRAPTGEACKGSTGGSASKVAVCFAQETIRSSCPCVLPDPENVDGPLTSKHAARIALRMIRMRPEDVPFFGEKETRGAMVC